ncbi:ParB/RepB/Spo0J family partition protein [Nonomuraea recticatena]|uniref:ParB-like N-terminal domain-containing protein n=1 Tax=Nonomuraea recticatena TaxID=46178 RepID=A0ABP6E3F4_9ACTN
MAVKTATTAPKGAKPRKTAPTGAPQSPTSDKSAATATAKIVAKTVPIDRIDRDPTQPREHFDEGKLQELALSMKELGQLQPVSVRYNAATRRYILIMGERRWRAAQIAGLTELRTLVHHGIEDGDPETLAKAVAENVGRADMTPMEEAKGFQRLVEFGYDIEKVAAMCGKSASYVGWRIDLLKLSLPLQEALIKGHVPIGLAWYVANLHHDNQARFLGRWVRGDFATARDAEAFAQACRVEEERQSTQGSFFVLAEGVDEAGAAGAQGGLFGELELPAEERERIVSERKKLVRKIEQLGTAGTILAEIATMDPGELALLLGGAQGGVGGQRMRIDHLKDVAGKAVATLRQAQAVASVRAGALQIAPDAAADTASNAA